MNRFGAFAVHLGISLIIFVILGYIILFHWYPDFFFTSDGGWQGIRIVALVDLVLGPLLTLVVYKKGNPSLKFDLTCIGVIQALCLTAGVWVVYAERPIAMVFSDGWFHSVTQDDYLDHDQPVPDFAKFSPHWVSVRLPSDSEAENAVRRAALENDTPLILLSNYYSLFDFNDIDTTSDGLQLQELRERDAITPFLEDFLTENGGRLEDYVYLPFGTRFSLALLAYRKKDSHLAYISVPKPD